MKFLQNQDVDVLHNAVQSRKLAAPKAPFVVQKSTRIPSADAEAVILLQDRVPAK